MALDRYNHFQRWARSKIGPSTVVAYTGTSARNGTDLPPGLYRIVCTTDAFILQGNGSVVATTSDYPLLIGQEAFAQVDSDATYGEQVDGGADSDNRFAAIQSTAGGNMVITLMSRLVAATP